MLKLLFECLISMFIICALDSRFLLQLSVLLFSTLLCIYSVIHVTAGYFNFLRCKIQFSFSLELISLPLSGITISRL